MKENRSIGFSKATITEEDGNFIITEVTKDEQKVYNLSEKLREWLEVDGVSLTIKRDLEIPSEE